MQHTTQMNKKKRVTSDIGPIECNDHIKSVSYLLYLDEKNTRSKKDQAMHWKYDAIEETFQLHEEGASGNLLNVWHKNIHGVSDMQEACLFQEWKEYV